MSVAPAMLLLAVALGGCGSGLAHRSSRARGSQPPAPAPAPAPPPPAPRPASVHAPNIVLVLTDDLTWNLVRFMPHVRALERSGETFSRYFVTNSLCCPSRASILTGRLPHDTGIFSNGPHNGGFRLFRARGEERQTFAVALSGRGYRTALMGKYLNGYAPASAARAGHRPYVPPGWSEWQAVGNGYPEFGYTINANGALAAHGRQPRDYLTDVLAERSVGFIERSAAARVPFMLEVATFAPHDPFVPAPRDAQRFPGLRAPRNPAYDAQNSGAPAWLAGLPPLTLAQRFRIDQQFRRRAQAVQALDEMVGRIQQTLIARGIAGNTYLLFTSDNGLHMGEHRLMPGKLTAFDSDIRVPLIVSGPGVPRNRVVTAMTDNTDLCPTFEQLAGARVPPKVDGHSLVPLLHGRRPTGWRNAIVVEHRRHVLQPLDPDLQNASAAMPPSYEALRLPHALYVEYGGGEREYYDLRRDPFELHNIAARLSPAHAAALHRALVAIARCHGGAACWRAEHVRAGPR